MRRRISRGELGSRRLVMLICAGYPLFGGPIRILLIHLKPWSDSLDDACLGVDCSSLNANENSWIGYRDLPPQIRSFF